MDTEDILFLVTPIMLVSMIIVLIALIKYLYRKPLFYICISVCTLLLYDYFNRKFYSAGDVHFTVWRTNGKCYVMPYRYWGLTLPKKNYLTLSWNGSTEIYVFKDRHLSVFGDPKFDSKFEVCCHLENCIYYTYISDEKRLPHQTYEQWNKLHYKPYEIERKKQLKDSEYMFDINLEDGFIELIKTSRDEDETDKCE